ncbi:C-type lectin domain family 9 member A-like isoform X1 [Hemitrygon akajei]|uniref:C-type lectin domain family 9 member A-like isoform X1 n=1 Tax=Hemitrygon akajei TaxID=2704970 RepID=UPI003BF9B256
MDESETYMNVKFTKTDSQFPSRDGLNSTYSLLKLGKTELRIDEDEDAPIALGPAELSVAAQAGPHKQEPNGNIGNRPDRKTCLLCLVTFVLVAIVVGLSMHVSLIRHSKENCHRNYQADLRHQFTEMEAKYRSVNETKAQICELFNSRREQASSQDWIRNKGGCYFISTFHISYDEAKQYCSKSDSKLIEINSAEEEKFVDKAVRDQGTSYWIGKCKDGKVSSNVVYRMYGGDPECGVCSYDFENKACSQVRYRFICEKSAALCPDISEKLQDLCQQPVGPS